MAGNAQEENRIIFDFDRCKMAILPYTQQHASSAVPATAAAAAATAAATQKNAKMSRSQPNDSETRKLLCMNGGRSRKEDKKTFKTETQYLRIDLVYCLLYVGETIFEETKTHTHRIRVLAI